MSDALAVLIERLRTAEYEEKLEAFRQIVEFGDRAVEPLIEIIRDENVLIAWFMAASALGRIGDKRALEPLIELLHNPLSFQALLARKYTAYALASLADPRAIDVLITMLYEPEYLDVDDEEGDDFALNPDVLNCETVEAAAGALIKIGEWRGLKAVINQLLEDECWYQHNIDQWGGDKAFIYLMSILLSDENDPRRIPAATLLAESRDQRALEPLINLLKTADNPRMRHSAAFGLVQLEAPDAFVPLFYALKDDYDQVRGCAATGISSLLITPSLDSNEQNPKIKNLLQNAWHEVGEEEIISILIGMFKDDAIRKYVISFLTAFLPFMPEQTIDTMLKPRIEELVTNPDYIIRRTASIMLEIVSNPDG